jgi:hypothetical protein
LPSVESLEVLLDALLAKAPDERPASAGAALANVEQLLRQLARIDSLVAAPTLAQPRASSAPGPVPLAPTPVRPPPRALDPRRHKLRWIGGAAVLGSLFWAWPDGAPEPLAAPLPSAPEATAVQPAAPAPRPASAERAGGPKPAAASAEPPVAAPGQNLATQPAATPGSALAAEQGATSAELEAVDGEGAVRPFPRIRRALDKIFGPGGGEEPRAAARPAAADVAAAKRAYRAGQISAQTYEDTIRALKLRRARRIEAEKQNLRAGAISRAEYKRRAHLIDAEYEGR